MTITDRMITIILLYVSPPNVSPFFFFTLSAAGNAFSQAARLHLQMQSKHDAATNFIDAGNAFKKADPQGDSYKRITAVERTTAEARS